MTPEPCLLIDRGWRCTSHTACEGWGYCRERNAEDEIGMRTNATEAKRRLIAKQRQAEATQRTSP